MIFILHTQKKSDSLGTPQLVNRTSCQLFMSLKTKASVWGRGNALQKDSKGKISYAQISNGGAVSQSRKEVGDPAVLLA